MNNVTDKQHEAVIQKLKSMIKKNNSAEKSALLSLFAERYYTAISADDLESRPVEEWYTSLLSCWDFIYQRAPGEAKVRVFSPSQQTEEWESKHTIVQVAHDNMPFLLDTIRMTLNRHEHQIYLVIHTEDLKIRRNKKNQIAEILPTEAKGPDVLAEVAICIQIDRQTDEKIMASLVADIHDGLFDAALTVHDWQNMQDQVKQCIAELEASPPPLEPDEIAETKDFLHWLLDDSFTFLGSCDCEIVGKGKERALRIIPESGYGVLRHQNNQIVSKNYHDLPLEICHLSLSSHILMISKTNTESTVHRPVYTDYIALKRFDKKGNVVGERRFIGLYTSLAYHMSPRFIPFIRHKIDTVMKEAHFSVSSHDGKELLNILENLPRSDLFQATAEELYTLAMGILYLQERRRIRLFMRKDLYGRYFSCLVFVPRDYFRTELRETLERVLKTSLGGISSNFWTSFSESILARIHFIVRVDPAKPVEYDPKEIECLLQTVGRPWEDRLREELITYFEEVKGIALFNKYKKAFLASYIERYSAKIAVKDIESMEKLSEENPLEMSLSKMDDQNKIRFKIFNLKNTVALSDVMPLLENMGLRVLDEMSHEIHVKSSLWINDFEMVYSGRAIFDIEKSRTLFEEAFSKIWFGKAENDAFNHLILKTDINWQQVVMFRTYAKYLKQVGSTFSQVYIEKALANNEKLVKLFVDLFLLKFSPEHSAEDREGIQAIVAAIEKELEEVVSLDEDRILRRFLEMIQATIRTNYFQRDKEGNIKSYLSIKLDPSLISDLPQPVPMYEIYVYSPKMEGIHLRGAKVARGGIRWSDRHEDFRTEVLGLMKAQQVKNAVIVPLGAKGGFITKQLPTDGNRDAIMSEVIECYSTLMRGMLDLTDNLKENIVIAPPQLVRHDADDPYLVVAADKGTATFSDIANQIAREYGFWLDDAFASGGSTGYDHKKMGITARGAWESVKRHFREIDLNQNTTDFTVVGIGDMAGDVFGNGLLLSPHIKLVGAFNHMHILVDPNPNAANSFEERKRLFALPRSAWSDYNPALISQGGGVYNRSAKSIRLSPEVKALFNIEEEQITPNDLIRYILKAPVDLLWNGGIGTFFKSANESHLDAGDRTNDAIRINGAELRCRVVAEGGNLGFTQRARMEYSEKGGYCFTDFIDNSAGVDCSDHEVNIKILLNDVVTAGGLTETSRNKLLEQMTEEVGAAVLVNNYRQTQMISLESSVANQTVDLMIQFMKQLEESGKLKRKLECLPDEKVLLKRKVAGQGLYRPEIAVLFAYGKTRLKEAILASQVPEDPFFVGYLKSAFPLLLQQKYADYMNRHGLRREIVATQLTNNICDHMGISFVERIQRETDASAAFVVRAFTAVEHIFEMREVWADIQALDFKVKIKIQYQMMLQVYQLIRRSTRWIIRNRKEDFDVVEVIDYFKAPIKELCKQLQKALTVEMNKKLTSAVQSLVEEGVPEKLAITIQSYPILFAAFDIIEAIKKCDSTIPTVAKLFFGLGERLELDWIREQINSQPVNNRWDELARSAFRDDIDMAQRKLTERVLQAEDSQRQSKARIDSWLQNNKMLLHRWQNLLNELKTSSSVGFIKYSVALREFFAFMRLG